MVCLCRGMKSHMAQVTIALQARAQLLLLLTTLPRPSSDEPHLIQGNLPLPLAHPLSLSQAARKAPEAEARPLLRGCLVLAHSGHSVIHGGWGTAAMGHRSLRCPAGLDSNPCFTTEQLCDGAGLKRSPNSIFLDMTPGHMAARRMG